jgi:hypothetical protein
MYILNLRDAAGRKTKPAENHAAERRCPDGRGVQQWQAIASLRAEAAKIAERKKRAAAAGSESGSSSVGCMRRTPSAATVLASRGR